MNKFLIVFALGPVQDFIATARRTQDLWIGSWLLSHLAKTAIEAIGKEKLVLPSQINTSNNTALADIPNIFCARVETTDEREARAWAEKAEASVRAEWSRVAWVVKKQFFTDVSDDLWARQVDSFLEVYWIVVPEATQNARHQAFAALDARKRVRDFVPAYEPLQKCALSGVHQEISGEASDKEAKCWWIKKSLELWDEKIWFNDEGEERLGAICTIKRGLVASGAIKEISGRDDAYNAFPSTSTIASALFYQKALQNSGAWIPFTRALEALGITRQVYFDAIKELSTTEKTFDGDIFYEETFTEAGIRRDYPSLNKKIEENQQNTASRQAQRAIQLRQIEERHGASLEEIIETYGSIEEGAKELGIDLIPEPSASTLEAGKRALATLCKTLDDKPSKYYALLLLDGDHMGAYFGKATDVQARDLSNALSADFVNNASPLVDGYLGRLVYAGGDDVLAFVPLENALECANELRKLFNAAVAQGTMNGMPIDVVAPTPSAGIVFAHHLAPLDLVLRALREAEKLAKNRYGRNALCVTVLKRSGQEQTMGAKWTSGDNDITSLVTKTMRLLKNEDEDEKDGLSNQFPQSVRLQAGVLDDKSLPDRARLSALQRLATRHGKGGSNEHVVQLAQWGNETGMEELANWLLLARFLQAKGGNDV